MLFISGYLIHRYPEIELIIRMYKITAIIILYLSPSYPAFFTLHYVNCSCVLILLFFLQNTSRRFLNTGH
nr:MAG TPA: hypothetical protein [Caudoviricetes sp.]